MIWLKKKTVQFCSRYCESEGKWLVLSGRVSDLCIEFCRMRNGSQEEWEIKVFQAQRQKMVAIYWIWVVLGFGDVI